MEDKCSGLLRKGDNYLMPVGLKQNFDTLEDFLGNSGEFHTATTGVQPGQKTFRVRRELIDTDDSTKCNATFTG